MNTWRMGATRLAAVGAVPMGRPLAHPPVWGQLSSPYGQERIVEGKKNLHTGADIKAPAGTPVFATLGGTVYRMYPEGKVSGYGNLVILEHVPGRLYSLYAHLDNFAPGLQTNRRVEPGAVLGGVGMTGIRHSAPHLHFEYLTGWPPPGKDRNRLNPGPILEQLGVVLGGGAAHNYRKREQIYVDHSRVMPTTLALGRPSRPYGEPLPRPVSVALLPWAPPLPPMPGPVPPIPITPPRPYVATRAPRGGGGAATAVLLAGVAAAAVAAAVSVQRG